MHKSNCLARYISLIMFRIDIEKNGELRLFYSISLIRMIGDGRILSF